MWEDQGAARVRKDTLKTCWPWHAEEPNMAKQFKESFWLICYILYICFFLFDASTMKVFASFHYHVSFFLSGCCGSSGIFRYQDKIYLKVNHCLLKYCTLHKTHFVLQNWQPYFLHGHNYQEYWFYQEYWLNIDLLVVTYVNLILRLK